MSARPYVTQESMAELRSTISATERAILADVAAMRLALATDLQALQGLRQPVEARQFRRTLQRLHERHVLFRLERVVGGRRAGSAGFVYGVGIAGQRLLASDGDGPARRPWTPRPSWLRHALAVSHLYVLLRGLEADKALQLVRFEAEPMCWRSFSGPHGGVSTLKPDVFVRCDVGDFTDRYFIEVDCGTESPATLARKLDVYRHYWHTGREQQQGGVFPQVVWLVPTEARLDVMRRTVERQPADAQSLHRVAAYDDVQTLLTEEPP